MSKLPPNVKTMARVAAGFGLAQSFLWLLLGSLGLASYLNCGFTEETEDTPPWATDYVTNILHRYFFLNEYCPTFRSVEGATSSYELHVWSALAITTSGLWLIISCCMFIFVTNKNMANVNVALYSWSIVTVIVSCTDIALGVVLGVSFGSISDLINTYEVSPESNLSYLFELSALRTGALILMVVALRGFVLLLLNITFIILMLYYAYLVNAALNRNEHNIHSMGPLYAYQGGKNHSEPWSTMGLEYDNHHGGQVNRGYGRSENERDRDWNQSSVRRDDSYYGRSLTRSDSWRRGKAISQPPKPFSYLEEPQMLRPQPPKAPSPAPVPSPSAIPPWKRRDNLDSSQPSVPSPDYSPPQNRQPRLKSALKSTAY